MFYPGFFETAYAPVLYQTETIYPTPSPTPTPGPAPAPYPAPYSVSGTPATVSMVVKVAFFYPPGEQMFSKDLNVSMNGPVPPANETEANQQAFVDGLGVMVTNLLNELCNQVVIAFTEHSDLLVNLPTTPPAPMPPPVQPGPGPGPIQPGPGPGPIQPGPGPGPIQPGPGPVQPGPGPGPVQPGPGPGPVQPPPPPPGPPPVPTTITPQMRQQLHDMFTNNYNDALACLADAELGVPATAGLEVNPDGSIKNWGCKEDGLRGAPACKCILQPILDQAPFPETVEGFQFIHVYK
jgi:hypothetical protein